MNGCEKDKNKKSVKKLLKMIMCKQSGKNSKRYKIVHLNTCISNGR